MKSYEKCVKLLSYGPCVALIGSLLIGSPQSFAQNAESSLAEPLRLTVAPQKSSRIAMKTLPKAVCVLHADGDSDTSHSLKLFSDDEGMIRFNVNPSDESDEVAAFAVDCTSDGQSRTFGLELRPNHTPSSDMPAPAAEIRTPKASDVIRPALTKAEAPQLSDDELVKREYPVRPNPKQAPDAFAGWLQAVTQPARRVDARQVAHPDLRASNLAFTHNWSGFDLKNAPNEVPVATYDLVSGEWYVPTVSAEYGATAYSVFWVGLDGDDGICYKSPDPCPGGDKTSDLWQAGTGQQITSIVIIDGGIRRSFTFSYYFAWTELVPTQYIEVLPNFNVSPGDLMISQVWVGNPGQAPSLSGADGIALVYDISQNEYTYVYTPLNQVNILGYQAEWIMERPYENGVLPDLADYNHAYMYFPEAEQINGSWINYGADNNQPIIMYNPNTNDVLSTAYAVNFGTIGYSWLNFH